MKTARAVLLGAAFGGSSGGIVGGGIAEFFAGQGPGMHGSLWLAAFIGAIVGGAFSALVWCLTNNYTFVALKLAWGEARGRECISSDTRPTEQRSHRPISAQPGGRRVFWAEALLLALYRSTGGYARRSRLACAQKSIAANL